MPLPVKRALRKLGNDLRAARLRRRISTAVMAERVMVSRPTLLRMEQGDPSVSMGIYATALFVLGLHEPLGSDDDLSASLDLALTVARSFGLKLGDAKAIAREVGGIVAGWRHEAARIGIREAEIDRMVSAFEHEDLEEARRL